ncbi:MAG: ribosome maturation factor RimM [Candidatus Eremiobacteraeota bacterium]|nr:ribosome maturation factor RimM [Candidatus Eremiobacteraeota bacterium]
MSRVPAGCISIGRIVGAFGLRGTVKVVAFDPTDLRYGLVVNARFGHGIAQTLEVAEVKRQRGGLLVRFRGVEDVCSAQELRGCELFCPASVLGSLGPHTYRDRELIGLEVSDARLGSLGKVGEVMHYPSSDVVIVGARRIMVPLLTAYGVRIDLTGGRITTRLPAGFEDI